MKPVELTDVDDPRLADYRALREAHLKDDSGKFVAESEMVVRKLLASTLGVDSLLVTPARWESLGQGPEVVLPHRREVAVWMVPQAVMDQVAGFHVHRGCLAIGRRPPQPSLPSSLHTVVVLEDLVDVDNLGAMVRNAAAFGVDALVLSPRCADPYYRKAIRVSMGNVFTLPIVRLRDWPGDLVALCRRAGLSLVGAVVDEAATPLASFTRPAHVALLLGSEGPGLSRAARGVCDHQVTIPMSGADSLNVATAGAVFLYALTRSAGA